MRRALTSWLAGLAALVLVLVAVPSSAPGAVAAATWRIAHVQTVGLGAQYLRLVREDGPVVAHAVRLGPDAAVQPRAVLSNDRVGPPAPILERTSEMCQRVGCLAAVNGDFADPGSAQPVGGLARGGRLLRSPLPTHNQLSASSGGTFTAEIVGWSAQIVWGDLQPLRLDALNRERAPNTTVLYTPDFGPSTATAAGGVEIVVRTVGVQLPLSLGQAGLVEVVAVRNGTGDAPIPRDGMVLSAEGPAAAVLRSLVGAAQRSLLGARALLRIETSPPVQESLGGSPLLLEAGRVVVADDGSEFGSRRHPRTLVAWNGSQRFLVAVDGRQEGYSIGLSLVDAAGLLVFLGATDGMNLDGGGSTTLVVGGRVVNRPSDRLVRKSNGTVGVVAYPAPGDLVLGTVERPVASALAVVPSSPLMVLADIVGPVLAPVPTGRGPAPAATDVASRPSR